MSSEQNQKVVVTGIDVPFIDWVTLLIKVAVASIPATIILSIFMFMFALFLSMFGMGLGALFK